MCVCVCVVSIYTWSSLFDLYKDIYVCVHVHDRETETKSRHNLIFWSSCNMWICLVLVFFKNIILKIIKKTDYNTKFCIFHYNTLIPTKRIETMRFPFTFSFLSLNLFQET